MEPMAKIRKIRKKRFLILSAGGPQSGIQGIYIGVEGDFWELITHANLPYPDAVEQLVEEATQSAGARFELKRIAWLDQRMSFLFLECAKMALAQAHKSLRQPHVVVMNKFALYNGLCGEGNEAKPWVIELGDGQLVASAYRVPVITDFGLHAAGAGVPFTLPLFPGTLKISKHTEPISLYLNIGLISHLTIVDNQAMLTVLDSDVGPGTCLINMAAREAGCPDGFDRDGSQAALGKVDSTVLETLCAQQWFVRPPPKQGFFQDFIPLFSHESVQRLAPCDKIATLTALTARSAFEFFKREYRQVVSPEVVWVSGGGANSLTLLDYISTYFEPIKIKSVEESGIPSALRVPLALGLTVHEYIMGHKGPWKAETDSGTNGIGTWIYP
jgi:anhydro-N-acetylmuramic acid kinase